MARPNPRTFGTSQWGDEESFLLVLEDYYRDQTMFGENTPSWIIDKIDSMENEYKSKTGSYYKKAPDPPTVVGVSASTNQIINDILEHRTIAPSWFVNNNINWVITGHISEQEFLTGYYTLIDQGIIQLTTPTVPTPTVPTPTVPTPTVPTPTVPTPTVPTPTVPTPTVPTPVIELPEILPEVIAEPDSSITDNMVTQQVINFNIVNGRAVGSIRFVATNNFNGYYYGHNIYNIIQFKDPNGVNILTTVKTNNLNFTATETDEVINYDEDMHGNTRATVESFVWSSPTTPSAFSKMYSIEISEAEPPKPITSGFMGAGAVGAIAGLVLLGFIIDHKGSKR